jgi:MoaA/NifB/PqqE/SkfB family radical SAM enzyme
MVNSILNRKLRNTYRILNHRDLIEKKKQAYSKQMIIKEIGVVELHPTDQCDLKCIYCTYGTHFKNDQNNLLIGQSFAYEKLPAIIQIKPKVIVFAGGGEPLLYNYKGRRFNDIVDFFKQEAPEIKLGLITNGTHIPDETCLEKLEWVRVSVDAVDKDAFNILKGGEFEKRLQSIINYAVSPIKNVGIGFLYNRFNLKQIPNFIKEMYYTIIGELGDEYLSKINIQFRPTCPIESCGCPSDNYQNSILMTPDNQHWWKELLKEIQDTINSFNKYKKLAQFVSEQTNLSDVITEIKGKRTLTFNNCYISILRWTIRANGNIYPCVIKASNENASIGNIGEDSLDELFNNEKKFFTFETGYCTGSNECCRIGGVLNELVEKEYDRNLPVQTEDLFF